MAIDDTHPEVRRLQFERLRRLSIEQRLAMVGQLSAMTTHLSRQAIRMAMPGAPEHAVILRWIELVYGADLAARVAPLAHRLGREAPGP
ncbi:MAG: hypothetical protein KF830_12905 [Planctomycetes bacterium]|nr:hypothetical protein [Planctomycetota bacterium]